VGNRNSKLKKRLEEEIHVVQALAGPTKERVTKHKKKYQQKNVGKKGIKPRNHTNMP